MKEITVSEAINLPDKAKIEAISGTVKVVFDPEECKGGTLKGQQIQNGVLTDGTNEMRFRLVSPEQFQDRSAKGHRLTIQSTKAVGGPAVGQLFGIKKVVYTNAQGQEQHQVETTPKALVVMSDNGSAPQQGQAQARQPRPASKIPFDLYIKDWRACFEKTLEVMSYPQDETPEVDYQALATHCIISYRRGEPLILLDEDKELAKDWESYIHPSSGKGLRQMYEKHPEKFVDSVLIPSILGEDATVPKPILKAAVVDMEISMEDTAMRWLTANDLSLAAIDAYIKDQMGADGIEDKYYVKLIKKDLIPVIKGYEPQETQEQTTTSDEGWD